MGWEGRGDSQVKEANSFLRRHFGYEQVIMLLLALCRLRSSSAKHTVPIPVHFHFVKMCQDVGDMFQ